MPDKKEANVLVVTTKTNPHDSSETIEPDDLISFHRAMKILEEIQATPEELAAWVKFGKPHITAYLNGVRFSFGPRGTPWKSERDPDRFEYLSWLDACQFSESEIRNFVPGDRYITGKSLLDRWEGQVPTTPSEYIQNRIDEARLEDYHPITGETQAGAPGDKGLPPLEDALFVLSYVVQIEAKEGIVELKDRVESHIQGETPEERKQRLEREFDREANAGGDYGALARLAKKINPSITHQTLSKLLSR